MIKYAAFFLMMFSLPVVAEKVTFDTKFSVEFPDGWKTPENPRKDALVYQESVKGDASFAVAKLALVLIFTSNNVSNLLVNCL